MISFSFTHNYLINQLFLFACFSMIFYNNIKKLKKKNRIKNTIFIFFVFQESFAILKAQIAKIRTQQRLLKIVKIFKYNKIIKIYVYCKINNKCENDIILEDILNDI